MRIVLLNAPGLPGTTPNREGAGGLGVQVPTAHAFAYPPHTIATIAANLIAAGHAVVVVDGVGDRLTLEESVRRVQAAGPEVVGLFVTPATQEADTTAILALSQTVPQAKLVAFGPGLRFCDCERLTRTARLTLLPGEAESLFPALLNSLAAGDNPAGLVVSSHLTQYLLPDNPSPQPAWQLVPWQAYGFLTVFTSKGCPDACAYCPYVVAMGNELRCRDVAAVVAEMAWLAEELRPGRVIVRDLVFGRDRERTLALCAGLVGRGVRLNWECEARPEDLDVAMLSAMRRAGCRLVKLGVETADVGLLQRWRRVASPAAGQAYLERVRELVRAGRRLGLALRLFVLAGAPGQTLAAAEATAHFCRQVRPGGIQVMRFRQHPGLRLDPDERLPLDTEAQVAVLEAAAAGIVAANRPHWWQRLRAGVGRVVQW